MEKTRRPVSRLPGNPGIWIFVLLDMGFFAMLFMSYALGRRNQAQIFAQAQRTLNVSLGLANTLILLTSSWLVASAVQCVRRNNQQAASALLCGACLCGMAFIGLKSAEYAAKIGSGISLLTNDFYMYYFVVTFIHFLHVVGGTIVLGVIAYKAHNDRHDHANPVGIEMAATYWHMVDLLWVFIFPIFYLASGS